MPDSPPAGPAGPIDLGELTLDESSGELRAKHADGAGTVVRLPPQPARLLAHLIRRRPEIVSRDEIGELLWPDVEVDLEAGVHTCIRQIRSALSDSAGSPRFVETIPRRGYRYIGPVAGDAPAAVPRTRRWYHARSARAALVAAALLAVPLAGLVLRSGVASVPPATPVRVAIMPFEPIDASSPLPAGNGIAEELVRMLTAHDGLALEVIGPTTTEAYDGAPQRLRELIDEFGIDYVINDRHTGEATSRRILVEVIRAADGAHVWAEYLDQLAGGDKAATRTIADAAVASVGDDRPRE